MSKFKKFLSLTLLSVGGIFGASLLTNFSVAQNFGLTQDNLLVDIFDFRMPNYSIYLHAITEPNTYSIVFSGNGSTSWSMSSMDMIYDQKANLLANNYEKDWYKFKWWSRSESWEVEYLDQSEVKNLTAEHHWIATLYAQREGKVIYIIEYYQENVAWTWYDLVETGNASNFAWTGIILTGNVYTWFRLHTWDEVSIISGWIVPYYYTRNSYSLTLIDGDNVSVITWIKYWATIEIPAVPTKAWYEFVWWSPNLPATMPYNDITVTAVWKEISSWWGGWWGWWWKQTENEHGSSEVNTGDTENNPEDNIPDTWNVIEFEPEWVDAYKWAKWLWMVSAPTIEKANLDELITREQLAKMMVIYMSKVLWKRPVTNKTVKYQDVSPETRWGEMANYIQLAYQYQIMWIHFNGVPLKYFNPSWKVSRAEFATVLSRVLFWDTYNQDWSKYYEKHIKVLAELGILNNTDPTIQEHRWWIILMLKRSLNILAERLNEEKANESSEEIIPEETTDNQTNVIEDNTWNAIKFEPEWVDAYKWSKWLWMISATTIEKADLDGLITREQLAKMMVIYMSKVLWKRPVTNKTAKYRDVSPEKRWKEMANYIQLAYQYQIMWIHANWKPLRYFNPSWKVSRAEFATVLSRVLFWDTYNQDWSKYYEKHIKILEKNGILNNTDPTIKERRWWVMLMLKRSLSILGKQ